MNMLILICCLYDLTQNMLENFLHLTTFYCKYHESVKKTDLKKSRTDVNVSKLSRRRQEQHLKNFLEENINIFKEELKDLGVENKLIITLGKDVDRLMQKDFSNFTLMNVPHYANYMSKEKYREYFTS